MSQIENCIFSKMFRSAVFLCCFYFMALTPDSTKAMTAEQKAKIKEHFEMLGMECINDNPITEEDINDLRSKKLPSGDGVPCFLSCIMKKIGVMDNAGMLQKESVLDLAKKVFNDEEELKNIEDYLHSCSHINSEAVSDGEKGCERAFLAYKCMNENASKFDIEV
uniref:Odorant-binding protein 9 n=1 Tax=Heortia vitessoides TaxID=1557813 RepID=A0A978W7A2_9NEOP|nr:odorant-binding protein 9 [Heortia vitessoides]